MFKWLSQPIGKSKQKPEQQPKQRSGQLSGKAEQKTGQLRKREAADPVAQDDTQQQAPPDSLRSLLNTAIADAEEIATSIKMGAQTEAEAEAARIIAQANLGVQEIKEQAEIAAQKQAEEILTAASKKAEITEAEAKQRALQFLVKVGQEMEKEVGEEYKKAYSRLSTYLRDLLNEGQSVEMRLGDKIAKLQENKRLELKEYEAALLGTSEVAAPPIETVASVETEEKVEEPVQLQEEAGLPVEEELTEEKVEEPAQLQGEAELSVEEEVNEEKVEECLPEEEEGKEEREFVPITLDDRALYSGETELVITSPVELKLVSRLYNYLQTIPELRILYTRGSWDRGTTITVVLEQPMPLVGILLETPDVGVVPELFGKGNPAMGKPNSLFRGGEGRDIKRIKLNLKEL